MQAKQAPRRTSACCSVVPAATSPGHLWASCRQRQWQRIMRAQLIATSDKQHASTQANYVGGFRCRRVATTVLGPRRFLEARLLTNLDCNNLTIQALQVEQLAVVNIKSYESRCSADSAPTAP